MKKLLLLDGSNLIFRAYYATEKREILTPDKRHANAIHTLISMINKMVVEHQPTHMFIALDSGKSTFRHEKYADYKGKRTAAPDRLKEQFPMAKELYEAMGVKNYATDRFEADDLIATYARLGKEQGMEVQVVSGDKDLLQLIDDNVKVLTPGIGFAKECNYTEEIFREKFGFATNRFIEFKALVGDSSDNIIGVEKIGAKTAEKFINNFESLDAMIEAAKDAVQKVENKEKIPKETIIKGNNAERLAVAKERLDENLELVQLIENVDVHVPLDELAFIDYNYETFIKYLKECGFIKYVEQFSKKGNVEVEKIEYNVKVVKEIEVFDAKKHSSDTTFIYTETLGENYHSSRPLGYGISSKKGLFYLPHSKVNDKFIEFLESDNKKVTYNLKQLMVILNLTKVNGFVFDTKLASSLINAENYKKTPELIFEQNNIDYIESYKDVYGAKSNPKMPSPGKVATNIGHKALAVQETYIKILNDLESYEQLQILNEIELPLTQVLAKMEIRGIQIDTKQLLALTEEFESELTKISDQINEITTINIKSPKQLNKYFFEEKGLPTKGIKKTKSGYSTDVENLEKLRKLLLIDAKEYELEIKLIELIFEYRIYAKLISTYLKGLEKYIVDGKLHPNYHQLLAETGRLSVSEPNIQNIPIRTKKGQVIRSLFNAPADKKVVAIDYSQVELRVIADMANETHMIEDFKNDADIHTETAKKIMNQAEVSSNDRSKAKAINFGIIYGMSAFGLAKQVGISKKEANEFIDKYFETYPQIKNYMLKMEDFAKQNGYVKTAFGRKRDLEKIHSQNKLEFENAKRMAINTPIQGTAADIIKKAMIVVDEYLETKDIDVDLVMQIHDELVFYIPEHISNDISKELEIQMQDVVHLKVKLKAETGMGNNWLEAK